LRFQFFKHYLGPPFFMRTFLKSRNNYLVTSSQQESS